jgi:hypothetical protein
LICLPKSPAEILNDYQIDVFKSATDNLSGDSAVIAGVEAALWRRFRHRAIGDYDHEYWQEILSDRLVEAWEVYKYKCEIYKDRIIWDLSTHKGDETRTQESDNTTTVIVDADSGNTITYNITNNNTGSSEAEDLPDTPVVAGSEYLSRRENNTSEARQTGTTGTVANDNQTVDTTGSVTGGSTAKITSQDGLTVELLNRVYDGIRNPFQDFAREMDNLFMNRW